MIFAMFSDISHRTMKASHKKTRITDSDIYRYRTSFSRALPCETQRDCHFREAYKMLETTNKLASFFLRLRISKCERSEKLQLTKTASEKT